MKIQSKKLTTVISSALLFTLGITACGTPAPATNMTTPPSTNQTSGPTPAFMPAQSVDLNGAGGTFIGPLASKWFDEYYKLTGTKINYQAIGSGGGISQIIAGTVDFGESDGIMTDNQVAAAQAASGPILHIPMTSGSEAIIYNLPGVTGLKLAPDVLADIFLKKITKWNDPRITAINQGLNLPNTDITVVHRSDGSGTTNIFTNYLSKVSTDWATKVGSANSVNWPGDVGGAQNAGVAGQVQQIPGAIGYVELAYALQNNLSYASLKNAAGNFVTPTLASTTAAAQGVSLPDDMKVMLTNSTNSDAYPIVGFTWVLVYQNQANKDKGVTLVKMLWWAIHDGQKYCEGLSYAPLSAAAVTKAENELKTITYQGQPIIQQ